MLSENIYRYYIFIIRVRKVYYFRTILHNCFLSVVHCCAIQNRTRPGIVYYCEGMKSGWMRNEPLASGANARVLNHPLVVPIKYIILQRFQLMFMKFNVDVAFSTVETAYPFIFASYCPTSVKFTDSAMTSMNISIIHSQNLPTKIFFVISQSQVYGKYHQILFYYTQVHG